MTRGRHFLCTSKSYTVQRSAVKSYLQNNTFFVNNQRWYFRVWKSAVFFGQNSLYFEATVQRFLCACGRWDRWMWWREYNLFSETRQDLRYVWNVDRAHLLTLLNPRIAPRAKLGNTGELTMLLESPLKPTQTHSNYLLILQEAVLLR